jgi:DNA-binding response OmpR family regulator
MTSTLPHVLLVEDDPVSRVFLGAAIQAVPATVDAADTVAAAFALATAGPYDLWLFDANLPDGSGIELLTRLRARDAETPALAHTASEDGAVIDALIAAGFREVLVKPLPAVAVQAVIRRALGLIGGSAGMQDEAASIADLPVWDDDAAARALNGNREHIATLRALFVVELLGLRQRVATAARDQNLAGLRSELHRLRASCGFVGAARLGHATQELHNDAGSILRLQDFDIAAQGTLEQSKDYKT